MWGATNRENDLKSQGTGFRVRGSGFRVQGSGFGVVGSGSRMQGLPASCGCGVCSRDWGVGAQLYVRGLCKPNQTKRFAQTKPN